MKNRFGYDGPIENVDANGTVTYSYISALHHYDIGHIARIWAESDTKNAADNQVLAKLAYQDRKSTRLNSSHMA